MTTERDGTRIVRSWLEDGATVLPARVLDAVLAELPATPQRRRPWPARRFRPMSLPSKVALASVALGLVLLGVSLPSLTQVRESPAAAPSLSPAPSPVAYSWPAPLAAGTYTTRFVWDAPVRFTFTVPDGWESRDDGVVNDPDGLTIKFVPVGNVYADPCGHVLLDHPVGPTVGDIVAALASLPGTDAVTPRPTMLAGYEGRYMELTVRDDIGCAPSSFYMWDAPHGSLRDGLPTGGSTGFASDRPIHRIWVLDVDGIRYLVDAISDPRATEADLAEMQAVVESIRIDRTADPASLGACTLELTDAAAPDVPLEEPYSITLGPDSYELRGMYPVDESGEPLTPSPPLAQIDFSSSGDGWGARPGAPRLIGPGDVEAGFATATPVNGYQGSLVFDAPGTWLAIITGGEECFFQFPVEVLRAAE